MARSREAKASSEQGKKEGTEVGEKERGRKERTEGNKRRRKEGRKEICKVGQKKDKGVKHVRGTRRRMKGVCLDRRCNRVMDGGMRRRMEERLEVSRLQALHSSTDSFTGRAHDSRKSSTLRLRPPKRAARERRGEKKKTWTPSLSIKTFTLRVGLLHTGHKTPRSISLQSTCSPASTGGESIYQSRFQSAGRVHLCSLSDATL